MEKSVACMGRPLKLRIAAFRHEMLTYSANGDEGELATQPRAQYERQGRVFVGRVRNGAKEVLLYIPEREQGMMLRCRGG